MTRVLKHNPYNAVKLSICAALIVLTSVAVQAADERPISALECQLSATFYVEAYGPQLSGTSVNGTGRIRQIPNWYCLVDSTWVRGQTKVCGVWGCNWHTKAFTSDRGHTSDWSGSVSQDCRAGRHRYRNRAGIEYRIVSISRPGFPAFTPKTMSHTSDDELEFSCYY